MSRTTPSGRRVVVPITVGVAGLALIGFGQALPNRHAIQDNLTDRTLVALDEADLPGVIAGFSGRDATVGGATSAAQIEKALAVVRAVKGVRTAMANVPVINTTPDPAATPEAPSETSTPATTAVPTTTAAPTETPTTDARKPVVPVGFTLENMTITITGTVKSVADRTELFRAAEAAGNGWTAVDRLTVDDSLTATVPATSRFAAVTTLLASAPIGGTKLVIQYQPESVILRGTPATAEIERTLLGQAAGTVGKCSSVIDGLDVPTS